MSANISSEEIKKMVSGNSTEKLLGSEGQHSPLLDLVSRLSGQLNQQTAESNLYRGGAGYGGSFMNKDQLAARERGETLGAKPYGGWGGYGSGNPTMNNPGVVSGSGVDPVTGGGGTYLPGGGGGTNQDGAITGGGQVPISGGMDQPVRGTGVAPPRGGGVPTGGANPPTRGAPLSGDPGMIDTLSMTKGDPYAALSKTGGAATGGAAPPTWGGNLKPGDPGWNPAWEGGGPSGGGPGEAGGGGYAPPAIVGGVAKPSAPGAPTVKSGAAAPGTQQYMDPNVQQIYEALVAKGMRPDAAIDSDSIRGMIAQGASPGLILKNYSAVMDRLGPQAFSMMHGQLGAMNGNVEDLTNGKWLQGTLSNAGVDPGELQPVGKLDEPMPTATTGNGGGAQAPGGNENPASVQTVPGGGGGNSLQNGPNDPNGDGFDPTISNGQPGQMLPKLIEKGKDWGPQPTPPKGMKPGDVYTDPRRGLVVLGANGRLAHTTIDPETGKYRYNYETYGAEGPQEHPPADSIKPSIGGKSIIGYDEYGNPVYNDNGMFEQGDNASGVGDVTPDAWNNSPDWRPEEPTGGLYGAYTQMAGGQMTDYENEIGAKWRALSDNPVTQEDTDYKNLVAEYNKTPGKGIDEAYGAYNTMINGNGYSDAEKSAMEGSAARGLSTGFARGADEIRRQAARTGNRAAAYSAMASGGAKYGADAGEMNRQNQIKFADEAQRRKEAGAAGMTDVAGLSNTRAQFGIGAAGDYAKEIQRRREAGIKGMGDFATYGRGLQSQGLAGLNDMLKQSNADKNNTYAQIAAILGTKVGAASTGSSTQSTSSAGAGFSI